MITKKRFIAGAVCPRCGEMDKVVTFEREGQPFRGCVACDFEESQADLSVSQELPTRVNQDANTDQAKQEDIIQIIPIDAGKNE